MITVEPCDFRTAEAQLLLDALSARLEEITGDNGNASFDGADIEQPGSLFVVARDQSGHASGCGAFRPLQADICEIKRMYASPNTNGIGAAILAYLERSAIGQGYREAWLETRCVNERAVRFYQRHGYRTIPNYGRYVGRDEAVCFAKTLRD